MKKSVVIVLGFLTSFSLIAQEKFSAGSIQSLLRSTYIDSKKCENLAKDIKLKPLYTQGLKFPAKENNGKQVSLKVFIEQSLGTVERKQECKSSLLSAIDKITEKTFDIFSVEEVLMNPSEVSCLELADYISEKKSSFIAGNIFRDRNNNKVSLLQAMQDYWTLPPVTKPILVDTESSDLLFDLPEEAKVCYEVLEPVVERVTLFIEENNEKRIQAAMNNLLSNSKECVTSLTISKDLEKILKEIDGETETKELLLALECADKDKDDDLYVVDVIRNRIIKKRDNAIEENKKKLKVKINSGSSIEI